MTTSELSIHNGCCGLAVESRTGSVARRVLDLLSQWHDRAQQRHELREMPDHLLKDMGITWEDAYRESRKPFWKP